MRARRFILWAASAVVFCCAVTGPATAAVQKLEQNQAAAKERIQRVSESLGQTRADLDSAREQATAAAGREDELNGLIDQGAERSAELDGQVASSRKQLEDSRRRLRRAKRVLAERLVAMYMAGTPDMVELAFGAQDFSQLASQHEYLVSIQNSDQSLAERVSSVRSELADRNSELTLLKARVDTHNAELAAARNGISAARSAAESSAAELASVNASRQGEITSLKSDISGWQKQIEKAKVKAAAEPPAQAAQEAEAEVDRQLGGPYAIPTYIVMCESGGNYSALNTSSGAGGAYQIMPATWTAYGGKGLPNEASKAEQDRIAALIYADSGTAPWVCG